ncbi:protein kinase domain-containing protein [Legionella yabuuchiae]|uniref:protein kinase domain-containing protein n=1 Tax=Legionella yabuuchiae TaxID=376727 RepID=UPI001056C0EC|nr:protein kinase [Legionella yabuuchiae]
MYTINLLSPQQKDLVLLTQLLRSHPNFTDFRTHIIFPIGDLEVSLSHTLVVLDRSDNVYQCAVLDNEPLGSGTYGGVYNVIANFSLENEAIKPEKPLEQEMVCKVQVGSEESRNEFEMSQKAPHLGIYPQYFFSHQYLDNCCYLFLKKQPGKDLFELLNSLEPKLWDPGLNDRFELSIKLLTALKEQIHDHGLVHRDIKPENIIVALENNTFTVNIIDLACVCLAGHKPKYVNGTPLYIAPECYDSRGECLSPPPPADYKLDVFAAAVILKELWAEYDLPWSSLFHDDHDKNLKHIYTTYLRGENLTFDEYKSLFKVILSMAESDPKKRMHLSEAITNLIHVRDLVFERHQREELEQLNVPQPGLARVQRRYNPEEHAPSAELPELAASSQAFNSNVTPVQAKHSWCSFFMQKTTPPLKMHPVESSASDVPQLQRNITHSC